MLMLFLPSAFKPPVLWCCRYSGRLWPKFGEAAARQAEKIFAALEYAADGHIMGRLALWSALAWTAEGGVFYFVGLALPAVILAEGGWLALPMGSLATLVPAAPGYAGTFDYFVIQAMLALGESPAAATAFAFVVHGVLWLPVTLIGAGYLAMFYRR